MYYLKKIYENLKDRILGNPKSTAAGVVAFLLYLSATFGFSVPAEIIALISSGIIAGIGLLKKD